MDSPALPYLTRVVIVSFPRCASPLGTDVTGVRSLSPPHTQAEAGKVCVEGSQTQHRCSEVGSSLERVVRLPGKQSLETRACQTQHEGNLAALFPVSCEGLIIFLGIRSLFWNVQIPETGKQMMFS